MVRRTLGGALTAVLLLAGLAATSGCAGSVELRSAPSVPPQAPTPETAEPAETPPPEIIVHNVEFDSARAQIRPESHKLLNDLAAILLADATIQRVDIDGHTDARGGSERNLHLSVYRAEAVRNYLVERGVPAERLVPRGLGEARPLSDNVSGEGRQLNRRVEFTIYRRSRTVSGP